MLAAGAFLGALLLAGCATGAIQPSGAAPSATLVSDPVVALDRYRLKIPLTLTVVNPGRSALAVEDVRFALSVEAMNAGSRTVRVDTFVEPGSSTSLSFELPLDERTLGQAFTGKTGPPIAAYRVVAHVEARTEAGRSLDVQASAGGDFPIVRDPLFRITSIQIERDQLVTSKLVLALEVDNPNAFPLRMGSFGYEFYGEGKLWTEGRSAEPVVVPAGESARYTLNETVNFADMDRQLLDIVAKLQVVRYRIKGEATILTDLGFLRLFDAAFDEAGSCPVER